MTGYTTRSYGRMIGDGSRTAAYVEALRRAVTPGSVVLDVGTGTGFFALLACRLGAARVYAIEPADAIHVARQCAGSETEPERIVWLQARSTEVDLPERVDVIVADVRGVLPFLAGSVSGLIDARRRHLKQGGHVIPSRDVLRAVPAEAPAEYQGSGHAVGAQRLRRRSVRRASVRGELLVACGDRAGRAGQPARAASVLGGDRLCPRGFASREGHVRVGHRACGRHAWPVRLVRLRGGSRARLLERALASGTRLRACIFSVSPAP